LLLANIGREITSGAAGADDQKRKKPENFHGFKIIKAVKSSF
jgi:hypothetical protein